MTAIIPPAALNQHIAILGKTGSGKSYAAKGIVEQLLQQGRQVCVVDPTAAWWGLRLASDGKARGFDVVLLGGHHADIPLAERSGSAVARLVTEQGANVVLDTSGFTVGEYTRWFIDFAGTLFTTIRNPLHLVIDEAHHFAPQGKSPDVDAGKMLHACNRLMSGGRSKGVRGMLITQRPAKLHKDSLSCADTLIAMRVMAPQDRAAIKEWIDGAGDPTQGRTVLDSLAQLQRGEGWVWYPEGGHLERVTFPKIKTYDSSATPAHGAKAGPKVAQIDLAEVQRAMAEAVKEAELNDPKLLRKRIAELQRQMNAKPAALPGIDQAGVAKAIESALAVRDAMWQGQSRELHAQLSEAANSLEKVATSVKAVSARAQMMAVAETSGAIAKLSKQGSATAKNSRVSYGTKPGVSGELSQRLHKPAHNQTAKPERAPTGDLGKAAIRVLHAFYWLRHELSTTPPQVAFHAGYTVNGHFNNILGNLRSAGLIEGWRITAAGESAAEQSGVSDRPTGDELQGWMRSKLSTPEQKIFDVLIAAGGDRVPVDELAAQAGYTVNGHFNNCLGHLRSIAVAEGGARDGGVKASDVFFG